MKRILLYVFVSLFSFSSFAAVTDSLKFEFDFNAPRIVEKGNFQNLIIDGTSQSIDPGKPVLPFKMVKLMIPSDRKVTGVSAKRVGDLSLDSFKRPAVSGNMKPLSWVNTGHAPKTRYIPSESYPEAIDYWTSQKYHGYTILIGKIHPVWHDENGKYHYSGRITLNVNTEKTRGSTIKRHGDVIRSFVDNPGDVPVSRDAQKVYDYLIIADSSLASLTGDNTLSDYVEFVRGKRGFESRIYDVADIEAQTEGIDKTQKIRNFIRKEYQENGISHVLLVGDADGSSPVIPARKLYSVVMGYLNGTWKEIKANIPADFYYSCLDGPFNGNGNDKWGEKTDGIDGGDVDFLPEVVVGRWAVDNSSQLKNVVKKTKLAYEHDLSMPEVLMVGEHLFDEPPLWGADYMEKLVGQVEDHGFVSNGYDSSWKISRLYDKQGTWASSQLKSKINNGHFLMLNHVGHSNYYINMKIYAFGSNLGFTNRLPYFFYTQGCHAGQFTANDSIVEKMLYGNGATFASVSNSHYGLGPEDPYPETTDTPGTSEILHRFFINRVLGTDLLSFAEAHQKSKEDLIIYIDHQEARWVTWATNYFGDPTIRLQ